MRSDRLTGPSVLMLTETPPVGPTLWRCFTVCERLEQAGYMAHHAPLKDDRVAGIAGRYDIIVAPRISWKAHERHLAEKWFAAVHKAGKCIVYESDDDLFTPASVQRIHDSNWEEGRSHEQLEQERRDRVWAMQQCDGVTVSTQRLATVTRQYTDKPVCVVPNAIDLRWFREVIFATERSIPGLTIGWAGGKRPDFDVDKMAEAWGRLARRYPDVTFVVQGWQPPSITEHVPEDRLARIPWLSLPEYPQGLRQVDIGCCAVVDVAFNRSKTPIKAWEHAVAGAAVVASPLLYSADVEHGSSGFIATTADEWEDALSQLIERPSLRSMMAKRLLRTVEKRHSLDANLHRWVDAWNEIYDDFISSGRTVRRILTLPTPRPQLAMASGL